jgi:ABC-type lipoprotein export system ATPase subunit
MTTALRIHKLNKHFANGKHALRDINLEIRQGEMVALIGASGSGKSTLLRHVAGLVVADAGEGSLIEIDGCCVQQGGRVHRDIRKVRSQIGFVFQQFNLIKGLSALENVILPAFPTGRPRAELVAAAMVLFERLQLAHRSQARVEWLSGGEQQRVAIARALINDPEVIIADEPTANLDTALSMEFMAILEGFTAAGKTVLLTSHDPLVVESSAVPRVVGMRDGRLIGD